MKPPFLQSWKIGRHSGLFSLGVVTSLGEGKYEFKSVLFRLKIDLGRYTTSGWCVQRGVNIYT